jgi:hypothetical protein
MGRLAARRINDMVSRLAQKGTVLRTVLALLVLLAVAAGPLAAYTIVLKDGSQIQAKEKYKLQGKRAVITLPNGTQSFIDAATIDVARTEQANKVDYGTAVVLGDTPGATPPPPPRAESKRLADLISKENTVPRELPEVRRETTRREGSVGRTRAGFPDFGALARKPFSSLEAAADLQSFFRSQEVEEVAIYQGTQGDRPLLEVTTNSEAAVFRALTVSSNALLHVRQTHPRVAALELMPVTPSRERAGQFVLTPEMAEELVARRVEPGTFYVRNVQF